MNNHGGALPIPDSALTDDRAIELVGVWAAHGGQHVALAAAAWEDPASWGLMLVDLARHAAKAIADQSGDSADKVLRRIRSGFDAEWDAPTDIP